jgi:chitodextrinase
MPAQLHGGRISAKVTLPIFAGVADTTPPTVPANFTSTGTTTTSTSLTWDPATDTGGSGLVGYNLYEVIGGSDVFLGFDAASPYPISGLTAGTTHTYRIRAVDGAGNLSTPPATTTVVTSTTADTTAPSNPSGIVSTPTTNGTTLTWLASTDTESGVAGYNVYVVQGGIDVLQNTAIITALTYDVTGLNSGTAYVAKVEAVDNAGNKSNKVTKSFTTTTPVDNTPPTTPGTPVITAITETGAHATWTASTDTGSGFKQYELVRPGGTIDYTVTTNSIDFTGLTASTDYSWTLRAKDNALNQSVSNPTLAFRTADIPIDTTPPLPASNLTTTSIAQTQVSLSWTASTSTDVTGYEIASAGNILKTGITGTTTTVTGLTAGTHYDMAVKAYDAAGNRSASNPTVSFSTSAPSAAGPFNRNAGFDGGNGLSVAMFNAVAAEVNGTGAATSGGRTALFRLGINWPNFGATDSPTAWPSGTTWNALADAAVANGMKIHALLAYASPAYTQNITFSDVDAIATPGNTYLQLCKPGTTTPQASNFGPPTKGRYDPSTGGTGGGWIRLSIHHATLPSGAGIQIDYIPSPGNRIYLQTASGSAYTIPAGAGGTDSSLVIGGGGGIQDQKMLPRCAVGATTALEPYGNYCKSVINLLGSRVATCELSNERNGILGQQPYVNIPLQYRNLCHGYCGVKLANANVLVGCASVAMNQYTAGNRDTFFKGYMMAADFYQAIHDEKANQPNYFSTLCSNLGVTAPADGFPFDFVITHPYQNDPSSASAVVMSESAAIYNMFGGTKLLMFGEQGTHWTPSSTNDLGHVPVDESAGNQLSPQGGHDWYAALIDRAHGNVRWNATTQLTGTDGANLAKVTGDGTGGTITVANRRISARKIFMPPLFFVAKAQTDLPTLGFFPLGSTTPKWTVGGTDPVGALRELT